METQYPSNLFQARSRQDVALTRQADNRAHVPIFRGHFLFLKHDTANRQAALLSDGRKDAMDLMLHCRPK
jgi:hypothetical protein